MSNTINYINNDSNFNVDFFEINDILLIASYPKNLLYLYNICTLLPYFKKIYFVYFDDLYLHFDNPPLHKT
jgi:hypothetical protein